MNFQDFAARLGRTRLRTWMVLAVVLLLLPGCLAHYHTAGAGPTGAEILYAKQWYAFWGLLPIGGATNSKSLAGDRVNYQVYTGITTWDFMLNFLTVPFGFYRSSIILEF